MRFLRGRLDNQLYLEAESLFEKVRLMKDKVSLLDPKLQDMRNYTESYLLCRYRRSRRL